RSSSSRRYQVATVTGWPSGWTVAMTAGLGRAKSSRTSGGRGGWGTSSPSVGDEDPIVRHGVRRAQRGCPVRGHRTAAGDLWAARRWVGAADRSAHPRAGSRAVGGTTEPAVGGASGDTAHRRGGWPTQGDVGRGGGGGR